MSLKSIRMVSMLITLTCFTTLLNAERIRAATTTFPSIWNENITDQLIDIDFANFSTKECITTEIPRLVDFIRKTKEFVKLSIFIHQTDPHLNNHEESVKLWRQLWSLNIFGLVSITTQSTVERNVDEEVLIFFSNEHYPLENVATMISTSRPFYLVLAGLESEEELKEIASTVPADIEFYLVSLWDGMIYEAYHFNPDYPVVKMIAEKNEENGTGTWLLKESHSLWHRRKQMNGLKIYGRGFRPLYFDLKNPLYHGMIDIDKYAVEVWKVLTESLHFTLVIYDEEIVNSTKPSTWEEMIALLDKHEMDVPTNLVTVTKQVADSYSMKATVFTASFQLIFHAPMNHPSLTLLNPFQKRLWIALSCLLFFLLPIVLVLLLRQETEICSIVTIPLRCVTTQGLGFSPEGSPARIGCLVTLLFGLLIAMFYESSLITYLTSKRVSLPFESLEEFYSKGFSYDLIYHKEISWALLGDWHNNHSHNKRDPISKMARGIPPPKSNRVIPLVSRELAGKQLCARPWNTTIFDVPFRQGPLIRCPYITTNKKYLTMHFGIAARHNLSAYPFITRMVKRMDEYGILDRIKNSLHLTLTQYKSSFQELSLDELGQIFFLYMHAVIFSVVILVLELTWFHGQRIFTLKESSSRRRKHHKSRLRDLGRVLEVYNKFKQP